MDQSGQTRLIRNCPTLETSIESDPIDPHIHVASTGETVTAYLRAMITGYEWVSVEDAPR